MVTNRLHIATNNINITGIKIKDAAGRLRLVQGANTYQKQLT